MSPQESETYIREAISNAETVGALSQIIDRNQDRFSKAVVDMFGLISRTDDPPYSNEALVEMVEHFREESVDLGDDFGVVDKLIELANERK